MNEITVIGARGRAITPETLLAKIERYATETGAVVQIMDARYVFGKDHLLSAARHGLRAFERCRNTSRDLATEILLYASGERQIKTALAKMGIKPDTREFALVLVGKVEVDICTHLGLVRDDAVLAPEPERLDAFLGASYAATDKLEELVLEKVAMRDLK